MNKSLIMLMLASSLSTLCIAADSVKVCVYDPETVMSQSKELAGLISEIDKKYQKQFDTLKKEEEALRDEASKLQKDANALQAKLSIMNETAREEAQHALIERQRAIERKKRDFDENADRAFKNYQQDRQKVSMRFLKKLEEGVGEFAQANTYDLVLPKGPGVYALARTDQTTALVTHMNKKFDETKKSLSAAPITVAKK